MATGERARSGSGATTGLRVAVAPGVSGPVLSWHEVVNDTVGDLPVAVVYCAICGTAAAFERISSNGSADLTLDFGSSGLLLQSTALMYDRQTQSLWSPIRGQAVAGSLSGSQLPLVDVTLTSFQEFAFSHPDGIVLSHITGSDRDYGNSPYPGYDAVDGNPFFSDGAIDARMPAMARVVTFDDPDGLVVVPESTIKRLSVSVVETAAGLAVLAHRPGLASPVDTEQLADGRDIGIIGVFQANAISRELSPDPDSATQLITPDGTQWSATGHALSGPQFGTQLPMVKHQTMFWFAAVSLGGKTDIVQPSPLAEWARWRRPLK